MLAMGVAYQDAAGYWRPVQPVVRNVANHTVSVTTTHFSDWALIWQGGTAAAEGPISLVQSYRGPGAVGEAHVPFTATGTATLYFLSDAPSDTSYGLTGTLSVQDLTIAVGGTTCVPDQRTISLPINAAEVHKSPLEFRWGIGVHWTLTCADSSTWVLPALFDTMGINLTGCAGDYNPGQTVSSTQLYGTYVKDCGSYGTVTASWDLRSCWDNPPQPCSTGVDCRAGLVVCNAGVGSCVDSGPAIDATPCGTVAGATCLGGVCVSP